jgi:RNA polymerase sigma-70 factor (ECF subfamily)
VEQRGWDERELVRRCKEGSEAAYAELVRQHRQRLLNLAARLTNSPHLAEDVVQETFLAAFRSMERFEPRPSVGAWLNAICVRLSSRAVSRSPERRDDSLDRMLDADAAGDPSRPAGGLLADGTASADPHAAAEAAEVRRAVAVAIGQLPFKQRTAVVLRYVVGLDYADAARTMDVPLNTFKSHLLRGTRALRESLDTLSPAGVVDDASGSDVRRMEIGAAETADEAAAAAATTAAERPAAS